MATTDRRLIKRYENRKLYDTRRSEYVTLADLAQMVSNGETVVVIDNATRNDVTEATLLQAVSGDRKDQGSPQRAALMLRRLLLKGQERRKVQSSPERPETLGELADRVRALEARVHELEGKKR